MPQLDATIEMKTYPNPWKNMRNIFFEKAIIRPYWDPDFSIRDFKDGARTAAKMVSKCIAEVRRCAAVLKRK